MDILLYLTVMVVFSFLFPYLMSDDKETIEGITILSLLVGFALFIITLLCNNN